MSTSNAANLRQSGVVVDAVVDQDLAPAAVVGRGDDAFGGFEGTGDDLYDQAVSVVLRDKKVSTSYIQRRLQIGYNKAASLIERMETEGVISSPNHGGRREILVDNGVDHDA